MPRDFHMSVRFGLHRLVATAMVTLLAILATMPAAAQELDPNSPPPARDYASCRHFDTQEGAQAALDSGDLDELGMQSLDGNGDGIACEIRWGEPGTNPAPAPAGVAKLPNTGTGPIEASSNSGTVFASMMLVSGAMLLLSRRLSSR